MRLQRNGACQYASDLTALKFTMSFSAPTRSPDRRVAFISQTDNALHELSEQSPDVWVDLGAEADDANDFAIHTYARIYFPALQVMFYVQQDQAG